MSSTTNKPTPANYGSTTDCSSNNALSASASTSATSTSTLLPGHLSTYTAGEDAGRLATMAKEFGLQRIRAPKIQVRQRVSDSLGSLNLESLKQWANQMVDLDKSFLELRYNSVYSAHLHELSDTSSCEGGSEQGDADVDDEEEGLLLGKYHRKLPSVGEDEDTFLTEEQQKKQKQLVQRLSSLEETVDPHAAGLGGSLSSATLGIIKGMVGPAILYLPHGFAQAGYIVAIPVLMLSTMLFLWSSTCLLDSWKFESDRVNRKRQTMNKNRASLKLPKRIMLSYPELAFRAFGTRGEKLVQVGISLMQSGVCLTYLIFVPQNLCTSALLLFNWNISTNWTLLLMMAVQIPFSWIRDIRRLTLTNLLANVLILYGLVTCLGFAANDIVSGDASDGVAEDATVGGTGTPDSSVSFVQEVVHRAQMLPAFNPSGWFLFLGTSVLLFEGSITLLVPLQEAVSKQSDREKFPNLYRRVIMGIVSFYTFFGIACWMAFGNTVRTVMTTSLPPGTMATTVQLAYSLAVVFTFPLQNFPSLEIVTLTVERMLLPPTIGTKANHGQNKMSVMQRNIISTILVAVLSIIAKAAMNDLDKVVSLMGSLLGCPLAFVLPPLIQNQLLSKGGQLPEWKKLVNNLVAGLGVGAMVVSSTATILNWE